MSDSIMQSDGDHVDHALVVGRRSNGRNIYSKAAKQRLVEVCLKPGVSLARVALHNGLNANLLRRWVTLHLRKGDGMPVSDQIVWPTGCGSFVSPPAVSSPPLSWNYLPCPVLPVGWPNELWKVVACRSGWLVRYSR